MLPELESSADEHASAAPAISITHDPRCMVERDCKPCANAARRSELDEARERSMQIARESLAEIGTDSDIRVATSETNQLGEVTPLAPRDAK